MAVSKAAICIYVHHENDLSHINYFWSKPRIPIFAVRKL